MWWHSGRRDTFLELSVWCAGAAGLSPRWCWGLSLGVRDGGQEAEETTGSESWWMCSWECSHKATEVGTALWSRRITAGQKSKNPCCPSAIQTPTCHLLLWVHQENGCFTSFFFSDATWMSWVAIIPYLWFRMIPCCVRELHSTDCACPVTSLYAHFAKM